MTQIINSTEYLFFTHIPTYKPLLKSVLKNRLTNYISMQKQNGWKIDGATADHVESVYEKILEHGELPMTINKNSLKYRMDPILERFHKNEIDVHEAVNLIQTAVDEAFLTWNDNP